MSGSGISCQHPTAKFFYRPDALPATQPIVSKHTHTHFRLTALFPGLPRWAGTRKVKPIWILLKQETVSGNGVSWVVCKSAPCSRQTTMPAPHRSVFYSPSCHPTNSVKALKANSVKALKTKSRKSKEVKLTNVIYVRYLTDSIWFYKLTFWRVLKKLLGHE